MRIQVTVKKKEFGAFSWFLLAVAFLVAASCVLAVVFFLALLKHSKSSGLTLLSPENIQGSLPLFFVVVGVGLLASFCAHIFSRSNDG
jgi:lysylphosphatidylglycerol synthetase-like protein (DUF2156 family)